MRKNGFHAALAAAFRMMLVLPGIADAENQPVPAAEQAAAQQNPALAAILAKADAEAAEKAAGASMQAVEVPAPAIAADAIAGDWQLTKLDATDVPYLYVDSTLYFAADGTVTIHQQLKNRDRTDDWTATVTGGAGRRKCLAFFARR